MQIKVVQSCANQSLTWRQQLARHKVKCDKPATEKVSKFGKVEDCCKCLTCGVIYQNKSGLN